MQLAFYGCSLEEKPYESWPDDPSPDNSRPDNPEGEDGPKIQEYEDGVHALARHTLQSSFSGTLEVCL